MRGFQCQLFIPGEVELANACLPMPQERASSIDQINSDSAREIGHARTLAALSMPPAAMRGGVQAVLNETMAVASERQASGRWLRKPRIFLL